MMDEPKQQGFKTLLEEERERHAAPVTVQGVDKAWWKREKSHWNSCPYIEDFVCGPSKTHRKLGKFECSGSWHEGCEVFMLLEKNGGDLAVLICE